MKTIKFFQDIESSDVGQVGGKGLSLGLMTKAGFPVPPGFVITTDTYRKHHGQNIDDILKEEIINAFDQLGAERVAVRSSAIAEDSPEASWAGQFESFLNVNKDNLIDSVIKCWESAGTDLVLNYAASKEIESERLVIAVVVQKMVKSEISGVAFSVNPINKNNEEMMIEAVYGLGELLVQGMATPDNYVVDKNHFGISSRNIAEKKTMLVFSDKYNDNIEESVPEEQVSRSCLDDKQLKELGEIIKNIEQYYGAPQDIEWAMEQGKFYITQSRPITTLH